VVAGDLTAASNVIVSGTDNTVNNVTAANADFLDLGTAHFLGTVSAPTITVTSSDIDVAVGASLGVYGVTDLLTLNAVSDQPILIGDSGLVPAPGQYELNEGGDIEAANIVFNALGIDGGPAPDISIYDMPIDGSQTPGGGVSSVTVNTGGSIIVEGALNYIEAAPTTP
jgi:hypothetical protein